MIHEQDKLEHALRPATTALGSFDEPDSDRLVAFVRFNPNPVVELDAEGRLTFYNEAARVTAAGAGLSTPEDLLPPGRAGIAKQCLAEPGGCCRIQAQTHLRVLEWIFFGVPAGSRVYGHAVDLTERVSVEAQLRRAHKLEAVGQLAAGIAHDFNNILTVIEGHAGLLLAAQHGLALSQRPLREIIEAADRAGKLVRQLLMFSRKQAAHLRPVDLAALVQSLVPLLERTLGEHIRVQLWRGGELPLAEADPGMIEQILMSLTLNARDAMPRGGLLTIRLNAARVEPARARENAEARPGHFVVLTVSDTGRGIPAQHLAHIFEPFFTTKGVGQGTGLGLASVYGAVKQHHGWIEVRSEEGRGTSFALYFPVAQGGVAVNSGNAPAEEDARLRGHETILVVEDEPALRRLVVEILEWHGYRVFSAASGALALDIWQEQRERIDLLVTDMVMPGVMGPELARRLLKENPQLCVIYTSGYSPGIAGEDLHLLEGANFLPKPYPPSRLLQMVRRCLDAHKAASPRGPGR